MLAHVSGMDESVGKIVESYKRHGFWDNTILIFSSDNGGSKVKNFVNSQAGGGRFFLCLQIVSLNTINFLILSRIL